MKEKFGSLAPSKIQPPLPAEAPRPGSLWLHWKGWTYEVGLVSYDQERKQFLVHYQSEETKQLGYVPWTHTLEEFLACVSEKDLHQADYPYKPGEKVRRFSPVL